MTKLICSITVISVVLLIYGDAQTAEFPMPAGDLAMKGRPSEIHGGDDTWPSIRPSIA